MKVSFLIISNYILPKKKLNFKNKLIKNLYTHLNKIKFEKLIFINLSIQKNVYFL